MLRRILDLPRSLAFCFTPGLGLVALLALTDDGRLQRWQIQSPRLTDQRLRVLRVGLV